MAPILERNPNTELPQDDYAMLVFLVETEEHLHFHAKHR